MKDLRNKVAVITGAGSGIGRALALQLSVAGARVALNDWNAETLRETLGQVESGGGDGWGSAFDVSDREAVFGFAEAVAGRFGQVDIVINNAGISLPLRSLDECPPGDIEKILRVNLWGVIHGSQAFLPYLKQRPEAALVNLSSVFGLFGYPFQGPYNMSKFAVRAFTETLRNELKGLNIVISSVHPGGIKTNIARNVQYEDKAKHQELIETFDRMAPTTADEAARVIIQGIRRKKPRILIGRDARFIDLVVRLLPGAYQHILLRRFGVEP